MKKEKIVKNLLDAYMNMNVLEKKITFAGLCDWWIQLRKQTILKEQVVIDTIEEIYKEYLELGEEKFLQKYRSTDR